MQTMTPSIVARNPFTRSLQRTRAKLGAAIAATCLFVGLAGFPRAARADLFDCTLFHVVWYDDTGGGHLVVYCGKDNANSFVADHTQPAACAGRANTSISTLKTWATTATTYQLAQHHAIIDFTPAGGGCANTINNIRSN
jgi:hypothetical protein